MTSTFTKTPGQPVPKPDPHKYVNYTLGMLLGVDDFLQEHAYLSGSDHWLTRELLGYGTASGLHVSTDIDSQKGARVLVDPGVAVSPRGQLIRVTPSQCAYLNEWLAANQDKLGKTPRKLLTVFVVLSYRACESDKVPISGEPCRSEDSLMASSRLSDDFILELRLNAPDQREEVALQAFVAWLRQVQITDPKIPSEKPLTTLEQFAEAILTAAKDSDPARPDTFMTKNPPTDLLISADAACDYWQTAFRIWTTRLRPTWRAACSDGDVPDEDSLMLAELTIHIAQSASGDWQMNTSKYSSPILVNEQNRPRLLHLRLLQQWMLCGRREAPPSNIVTSELAFGQKPDPGSLNSYSRADHSHGTPDLSGDVRQGEDGAITVQGLQNVPIADTAPTDGQILVYDADDNVWRPTSLDIDDYEDDEDDEDEDDDNTGDVVTNEDGSTTVQGLRNIPIADTTPTPGQVLLFTDEQWQPIDLPPPPPTNYVEHPPDLGRYRIAAAGLVRCDRTSSQDTYNNLVAWSRPDGFVLVNFRGYTWPASDPYIVKVLPVWSNRVPAFNVYFDRFQRNFFALRVTDSNGDPVGEEEIEHLEMFIEVSQYKIVIPLEEATQIMHAESHKQE